MSGGAVSCPDCDSFVDEDADAVNFSFASHQCIHCGLFFEFEEGTPIDMSEDEAQSLFEQQRDQLSALIEGGMDPVLLPAAADDILAGGDGEKNRAVWEEIADFIEEQGEPS